MKDKKLQTIPVTFEKVNDIDDRFMNVKIYLMHTGLNKNGSFFEKSVVENSFDTLHNTPILGYIQITEENESDFEGHKHILIVENGQYKLKYAGSAYGVIGESCNPRWEMKTCDDGVEREFLVVDGILWRKFEDASDIFDRDEIKQQSMELADNFDGYMHDDGYFVFTRFSFYGACALGDSKTPAMQNASIEKVFSFDEIKEEIQKNMELLKFAISTSTPNQDVVDIDNEGGNIVDEKLKLIEQYQFTVEILKDKGIDIEQYSVEDLEVKLKEMTEEPETDFAMSGQIRSELVAQLGNEKVMDRWGDQVTRYYYVEHDEANSCVFAEDRNENWNVFKFNYSMSGDNVVIDWGSRKKQKFTFVDWEDGSQSSEFTFVPQEVFEQLNTKFDEQKNEFEKVQGEFTELKSNFETIEGEHKELFEFKANIEKEQREVAERELFEQFADKLDEETLSELKESASEFTLEELEKELKIKFADKNLKFTQNKSKTKLNFDFEKLDNSSDKPYADRIRKYVKK